MPKTCFRVGENKKLPDTNLGIKMEHDSIRIGADEIILWLRKNNLALNIPNDGVVGLGRRIHDLIVGLGGRKIEESAASYWDETDSHVQQHGLPKTSAQYEVSVDLLPPLYRELLNW